MLTETEFASDKWADSKKRRMSGRTSAKLWVAAGLAGIAFVGAWLKYSPRASGSSAGAPPAALPQVMVSKPLAQDIDTRLGFLGQFAAVSQVDLRAQVGGTLTGIFFKDGDIVRCGEHPSGCGPRRRAYLPRSWWWVGYTRQPVDRCGEMRTGRQKHQGASPGGARPQVIGLEASSRRVPAQQQRRKTMTKEHSFVAGDYF